MLRLRRTVPAAAVARVRAALAAQLLDDDAEKANQLWS